MNADSRSRCNGQCQETIDSLRAQLAEARKANAKLLGTMTCSNTPSCGETDIVWTDDMDMQCSKCGHPMRAAITASAGDDTRGGEGK